jgi:hypothetical protein
MMPLDPTARRGNQTGCLDFLAVGRTGQLIGNRLNLGVLIAGFAKESCPLRPMERCDLLAFVSGQGLPNLAFKQKLKQLRKLNEPSLMEHLK